jgi:hypothetical protein
MQKWPVNSRAGLVKIVRRIAHDLGVRLIRIMASPPRRLPTAAVAIVVRGHSALTATPAPFNSPDKWLAHAHAELRHGVGGRVLEPFCFMSSGGDSIRMRVLRLLQVRDAVFRHHERAARIDPHHQVEPLHVGSLRVGEADGAGIVDADIDAAEFGDGPLDRVHHLRFLADIADNRQRLPPAARTSSAAV